MKEKLNKWNIGETSGPHIVSDMTSDGRAVVKTIGRPVVFVRGGLPGDTITFTIDRTKKSWASAHLEEVVMPSKDRVDSPCPQGDICGGCPVIAYDHHAQMTYKQQTLTDRAKRLDADHTVGEPLCVADAVGFRNHMQFRVQRGQLGLWTVDHRFCALDYCYIFSSPGERIRKALEYSTLLIPSLQQVGIRTNALGEGAVILVTEDQEPASVSEDDLATLRDLGVTSCVQVAAVGYQGHYGSHIHTFLGDGTFREMAGDRLWTFDVTGFFQTNTLILEKILVRGKALMSDDLPVVDLFCGVGVLGQVIGGNRLLMGNEYNPKAVAWAQHNAKAQGIHATYLAGPAEDIYGAQDLPRHQLILDPPRAGLHEKLIDAILAKGPERILYVSCDQATLMRDLARLQSGYAIQSLQIADMFSHSAHVETICLLSEVNA